MKVKEIIEKISSACKEDIQTVMKEYLDSEINIPDHEFVRKQSYILKVLSSPIRLKIIYALENADLPVCVLTDILDIDQTLLSHHLAVLKRAGIVDVKIRGKFRIYYLKDKDLPKKIREICVF